VSSSRTCFENKQKKEKSHNLESILANSVSSSPAVLEATDCDSSSECFAVGAKELVAFANSTVLTEQEPNFSHLKQQQQKLLKFKRQNVLDCIRCVLVCVFK